LSARGRFVLGDVVIPDKPSDAVTPVDGEYDRPDTIEDQLGWMTVAGFEATASWQCGDLAVMVADCRR
jgi:tRNA (cmo5U34)-methyltransferase